MADNTSLQQEYSDKIKKNGAIKFVGSHNRHDFDSHSETHYTYLLDQGLLSNHKFLDVGCGALRTGAKIIPYLEHGNYYGLDRMPELIEYGLNDVLPEQLVFSKAPKFSVNDNFDLSFVKQKVDFVWCQSLMSHLDENDINRCLKNIKSVCNENTKIYFTYFQQRGLERGSTEQSHSKKDIRYSSIVMDDIVREAGLVKIFNGTIGHPRGQWMYISKV
jgi:SAM-dependent methyltransferase